MTDLAGKFKRGGSRGIGGRLLLTVRGNITWLLSRQTPAIQDFSQLPPFSMPKELA